MLKKLILAMTLVFAFPYYLFPLDNKNTLSLTEVITSRYKNINSVIVSKNKNIIYEKYFNNHNENTLFSQNSVTKTITALAIGVCIDNRIINDTADTIKDYINDNKINKYNNDEITIFNLLTMTDGKKYKESTDVLVSSGDLVSYFLDLPSENSLSNKFRYSSLNSQILSRIITNVSGQKESEFVKERIFKELNILDFYWMDDHFGITYGGFGLSLKARDMLKIGYLMLDNGEYQKKRVVSEKWINEMSNIKNNGGGPHNEKYGYHCWITNVNGYSAYFAGGFGGQFIYIIPNLKSVIIITSSSDQHREFHRNIIGDFIISILEEI